MSISSSSDSEQKVQQLPNRQRKKSGLSTQQHSRKYVSALAAIIIIFLAFTNFAFIPVSTEIPNKIPPHTGQLLRPDLTDSLGQDVSLFPIRDITSTLALAQANPPTSNFAAKTTIPVEEPTVVEDTLATESPLPDVDLPATPKDVLTETATLDPTIEHVVIISIDGLRPDALALADTPNIDKLIAKGAYNPNAQSVSLSITLPSHASMLSGMPPEKHGILWGIPYIGWPGMEGPTVFSVVHDAGLSTALVAGKKKFDYLVLPNSIDNGFCADAHDLEIKETAVEFIEEGLTDVLFVHFPDVDRVGHAYGWMSENQMYAINYVDNMVGGVIDALENEGYMQNTLLIVTSDHGGRGFKHGDDSPLDRTIPWLAVGPGVPQGVTLNNYIYTLDTAATALHALDIPIPEKWEGKPVMEIFE